VVLLAGILVLASSAEGISISVSSNRGGFTENIDAGEKEVRGSAIIAVDGISNSIKGGGSLNAILWGSDAHGNFARTGANILEAESYSYNSYLLSSAGFFGANSTYSGVSVNETLNIINANYIEAYANALNRIGKATSPVSIVVFDQGRKVNLTGYYNSATASMEKVTAFQNKQNASDALRSTEA
jgi:hypothetical protein